MRRLFKKGELVRSKRDGKVMEVLRYLTENVVMLKWFDLERKEVTVHKVSVDDLSKAA